MNGKPSDHSGTVSMTRYVIQRLGSLPMEHTSGAFFYNENKQTKTFIV